MKQSYRGCLAALELISDLSQSVISFGFGLTGLGLIFWVPTWPVGLAAVWLLWRPASSAFFKPQGFTQAAPGAQLSSPLDRPGHGCRVSGEPC